MSSKGLEKIIFLRISNFISKHNLVADSQHCFRQGKSTETALLTQKELWIKNIDANELTLWIFIDYSKAFDYINHKIVLNKLYAYGVRGPAHLLFRSYLEERIQCVSIENRRPYFKLIKSGEPQGSLLGPLLFNLYVNDVEKKIATQSMWFTRMI